jgi:hypothetical protein
MSMAGVHCMTVLNCWRGESLNATVVVCRGEYTAVLQSTVVLEASRHSRMTAAPGSLLVGRILRLVHDEIGGT